MKKIKNGLLVILEGGEGVGKTTQSKDLVDYYNSKGYSAKYFREPGSSELAEKIRNLILYNEMDATTETLLFSAARNINVNENILPALRDGNIVILDRFYKSTMVYQGVLKNTNMKFIIDCINEVTKDLFNNDMNMLEFTLLCDPEIAMERAASEGHERNKNDVLPYEKYKIINDAFRNLHFYQPYEIGTDLVYNAGIIDTTGYNKEEVFTLLLNGINSVICDELEVYED